MKDRTIMTPESENELKINISPAKGNQKLSNYNKQQLKPPNKELIRQRSIFESQFQTINITAQNKGRLNDINKSSNNDQILRSTGKFNRNSIDD